MICLFETPSLVIVETSHAVSIKRFFEYWQSRLSKNVI